MGTTTATATAVMTPCPPASTATPPYDSSWPHFWTTKFDPTANILVVSSKYGNVDKCYSCKTICHQLQSLKSYFNKLIKGEPHKIITFVLK